MQYFTTKIKVDRVQSSGVTKKVTEVYVVKALSVSEAEAITTKEIAPTTSGEYQLVSATEVKYSEVMGTDADRYYNAKVNFLSLDEKTGAEKKNASMILVSAASFDDAYKTLKDNLKSSVTDWEIAEVKETVIVDLLKTE